MNSRDSLFSRLKKPVPCFICKAKVKNHDTFCMKCRTSIKFKSSTPVPHFSQKPVPEKVRYFHIKVSNSPKDLKQTACFNDPESVPQSLVKNCIDSSIKERSLDNIRTLSYSKRPSSSLDFKSLMHPVQSSKVKKKRKAGLSQKKYFRLTKSPIPELRTSDFSSTHSNPSLFPLEKYSLHLNSVSSLAVHSGRIYSSGLDYKIFGLDLFNMNKVFDFLAHKKAVTRLSPFKDLLVSAGKDGKVKYWKEKCVFQYSAHCGGVFGLASNDSFLFTGNESVKVWQERKMVNEYQVKVKHLATMGSSLLCSAGKDCKVWDVRCCKLASVVSTNGNFNIVRPWDENSLWTATDSELRKWDLRNLQYLDIIKINGTKDISRVRGQLLTAGDGLCSFGKVVLQGNFTCLDFDDELSVLFAGDRAGLLHIFKI